jgi:hypothetical protein
MTRHRGMSGWNDRKQGARAASPPGVPPGFELAHPPSACVKEMARREGLEPPTPRFEAWCSIQLSYRRVPVESRVRTGGRQTGDRPVPAALATLTARVVGLP